MRVRKYHQTTGTTAIAKPVKTEQPEVQPDEPVNNKLPAVQPGKPSHKQHYRDPANMLRKIMKNPNLNIQLMVIVLTLASDNFSMDRSIDSMSSAVDKIRNITDVINNTMQSVKVAADAPKQIRQLFETQERRR